MQQIVEFRWFVLLSRVQGKIYVVTNETFPNLLFSTLCTQFNSKTLFGMNFCLEIGANLAASPGLPSIKFVVLLSKICNRFC